MKPFNPLDKKNLGTSVAEALLEMGVEPLPPENTFVGAGIYAIYYAGSLTPYKKISELNSGGRFQAPIYVGKAIPPGARKGGFGLDVNPKNVLHKRLCEHAKSIENAENLNLSDFFCRYLVTEDIWIPLGERLLIEKFSPIWNNIIDGFGNHDPGKGRYKQKKSDWDVLHPGRPWADRLQPGSASKSQIISELNDYYLALDPQMNNESP